MLTNEAALELPFDEDALLVQRAKEREPSAWVEIYDAYHRKLYFYCYARTGDQATAADLASQVYLEALDSIGGFRYRGRPLLAWLYRIGRNVVSDHLRARERETKAIEQAAEAQPGHERNPAGEVADRADVLAALPLLTDDQRQVIALRFYACFTTAEIADAMGRGEAAVYSLEVRALAALRRLLGPGRLPEADDLVA